MNRQESDVLLHLYREPFINQRLVAEQTGHSLGVVNRCIKNLMAEGYLDEYSQITSCARRIIEEMRPQSAVILAAGFGMRMVPINRETPKAMVEVYGEPLIERLIKQLHEAEVHKIYVVVGFMKESFEYLIDEFGVELIVNNAYATKNNLHSLALVADYLNNSYIVPCDIWCKTNPFHSHELYSWYMVSDQLDDGSGVRVNRKTVLCPAEKGHPGNTMIGISYLTRADSLALRLRINAMNEQKRYDASFWEKALFAGDNNVIYAKVVHFADVAEINTYEQLRNLDSNSNQLKSQLIEVICDCLCCRQSDIVDLIVLKKGMTNRSFLFSCRGKKYIMRIPGEGTDQLINRDQEAEVYRQIADKGICDNIVYINPQNGYKITEYIEGARVCDPYNESDIEKCMRRLRAFHEMELSVEHEFDIFGQIEYYERLWGENESVYKDYRITKEKVLSLRPYIQKHTSRKTLTHIDAVPDNFLFSDNFGTEEIHLIDWEYAGMQDPYVDIAMFCVYAMYDRYRVDHLIDLYFEGKCPNEIRAKIYCYIASCGLLWSNWCEYKRSLGVEFGEYSLRQYRFAKDYYKLACAEIKRLEGGI